jgi:YVTN family beta-propeller protein
MIRGLLHLPQGRCPPTLFALGVVLLLVSVSGAAHFTGRIERTAQVDQIEARAAPAVAREPSATATRALTSQPQLTSSDATSLIETILPNYNMSLNSNFPAAETNWKVGFPAYVPTTRTLWLPQVSTTFDGVSGPDFAPALIFDVVHNRTIGPDYGLQNSSAILFDPINSDLYATNPVNDTVEVVNSSSGSLVAHAIPVGNDPIAMALDPTTDRLYVADYASDSLTLLNCTTNSVAKSSISLSGPPESLAFDATDHRLFVADGGADSVLILNTKTNATEAPVPTPGLPGSVAYSPLSGTVAVTIPSASSMEVFIASTRAPVTYPAVGPGFSPVIVSPDGKSFLVGNSSGPELASVNSSTGSVKVPAIPLSGPVTALVAGPNSTLVYTWSSERRTVSTVNLASEHVTEISPTLEPVPASIAYDPLTNRLFVAEVETGTILVLNASTGYTTAPSIPVPNGALSVSVDPITDTLYAGAWDGVYAYNTTSDLLIAASSTLAGGNSPVVVDQKSGLLWVANQDTGLLALHLGSLTTSFTTQARPPFGSQDSISIDSPNDTVFVLNGTSGALDALNESTGQVYRSSTQDGTNPSAVVYDPLDSSVYVLGANLTILNPLNLASEGSPISLGPHAAASGLVFDPSRGVLIATTYAGGLSRESNATLIQGTSAGASHAAGIAIPLGELASSPTVVSFPGSEEPALASVWIANSQSGTLSLLASPPVISLLAASPTLADVGERIQFLLGYSGGTGPVVVSYSGLPQGCVSADTTVLSCTPSAPGNFTITAWVLDAFAYSTSASTTLTVASALDVRLSLVTGPNMSLDVGSNFTAEATAIGGVPGYQFSWTFGDGSGSSGPNVTHAYGSAGTYLVTVVANDSTLATASESQIVQVAQRPVAEILASPSNATDVGLPLELSAMISGGTAPGLGSWTFGDGSTATGLVVNHAWTTSGSYTVTFRYVDAVGAVTDQVEKVIVAPALSVIFGTNAAGSTISQGVEVRFSATVTGGISPFNVTWSFGDGTYAYGLAVSHEYASSGQITVLAMLRDAAGARVNASLQLSVLAASSGASGAPGPTSGAQLFLGILIGGAIGAALLVLVSRRRKSPPLPPTPYVPPS